MIQPTPSLPFLRGLPFTVALAFVLALGPGTPMGASAQDALTGGPLPSEIEQEILEFLNDPSTLRAAGGTRIPAQSRLIGPLGVLGGELRVSGVIEGPVMVVNGDLSMAPGARIVGDVLVVGGRIEIEDSSQIRGAVRNYMAPLRFRIRADQVEPAQPGLRDLPPLLQADLGFATLRPVLRSAGNYNRSEGLPVHMGAQLGTGGRNPTELDALALWRSASGLELESEALGYRIDLTQELGGSGEALAGFSLFSETRPIERRGLSRAEAAISTFFLRRDVRDYFETEGWSLRLELNPLDRPLRARLEYREETHATALTRNPWTLRDQNRPWRPAALVAEGPTRLLELGLVWDTRNDLRDPATGWLVEGGLRRQVGGGLRVPDFTIPEDAGATPFQADDGAFSLATDVTLDIRRYNRLGPNTRFNLRLLVSGAIDGDPLPPQFQRSLGGEGSLPGHPRFSIDCGARIATVDPDGLEPRFPAYGCDRVTLLQAEIRGSLPFSWRPDLDDRGHPELASLLELRPAWTLFAGAGRGRVAGEPDGRRHSPVRADVGVGLYVGPLGLYWAYPLNRNDRGLNFFIRLERRF